MTQDDLMNTGDIAAFLRVSRAHATDHITKRRDFPAPVINLSTRLRYWARAEVIRWAQSRRAMSSAVSR